MLREIDTLPCYVFKIMLKAKLKLKLEDCFGFKIGFGTIFSESDWVVVWPVCRAIEMNYFIGFNLRNREDLMKLSEEFAAICESSREVFDKVVLALDGLVNCFNPPILSQ